MCQLCWTITLKDSSLITMCQLDWTITLKESSLITKGDLYLRHKVRNHCPNLSWTWLHQWLAWVQSLKRNRCYLSNNWVLQCGCCTSAFRGLGRSSAWSDGMYDGRIVSEHELFLGSCGALKMFQALVILLQKKKSVSEKNALGFVNWLGRPLDIS